MNNATRDEILDSEDGISVRKSLDTEQYQYPAIVFNLTSDRDAPVQVRLVDDIPESISMENIGFYFGHVDAWSKETDQVAFEKILNPNEEYTTGYAVKAVDDDTAEDLLSMKPGIEVSNDGNGGATGRITDRIDLNVYIPINVPFPVDTLENSLESKDYEINRSGQNLVGQQNGTVYYYERDTDLLSVRVNDPERLGEIIEELQETIGKLAVSLTDIDFLQVDLNELVWSGNDTTEVFSASSPDIELSDTFSHTPKPASLRFVSHSSITKQSDYFDIRIESYAQNTDYYYVGLVYRKPNFEEMIPLCRGLQQEVYAVISKIEGRNDE